VWSSVVTVSGDGLSGILPPVVVVGALIALGGSPAR
jgi:hypothetical protein